MCRGSLIEVRHTNFEDVLSEGRLVLLAVLLVDSLAESGEVDVTIPGDLIGHIQDLLL